MNRQSLIGGHALYPFVSNLENLSMGVSLEYSAAGGVVDFSAIELLEIARYEFDFGENIDVFAQAGIGVTKWEMEYERIYVRYYYGYRNYTYTVSRDDTEFGIALGGGIKFMEHFEAMTQVKFFGEADSFTVTVDYNF